MTCKDCLRSGRYQLIPAFFTMLRYLKKTKRQFGIVFHTFGSELPRVIAEFNA